MCGVAYEALHSLDWLSRVCRAVVLFRPAADDSELRLLLSGSLGKKEEAEKYAESEPAVGSLTRAYSSLMHPKRGPLIPGGTVFRKRYGLRDFYNFGRYFARVSKGGQLRFPPSRELVLRCGVCISCRKLLCPCKFSANDLSTSAAVWVVSPCD